MLELLTCGAAALNLILDDRQLAQFESYYRGLLAWNQQTNLTAITSYEEVQTRHFLDSLTVIQALPQPVPPGLKLLDVGAGAGFPGLPLKIACPGIALTLLEATGKKAAFLAHMTAVIELPDVVVLSERAEEAARSPEHRERYDVAVSRAVADLPALLELTLPFCRIGGRAIAQKKGDIQEEIRRSSRALEVLGGGPPGVQEVSAPGLPDRRFLVVVTKIAPTPDMYPRRSGMPAKKPLI